MKSALVIPTASAALAVLAATPAMAASPAPVFSWTGCYVGAHAGGGVMRDTFTDSSTGNGTGAVAGGQVGCNYQNGNAVFGVEGEGYWSGIKNSRSENGPFSSSGIETRNRYDFSIAGRLGAAFDRTLIYGKAGWVWGQFDFSQSFAAPPTFVESFSKSSGLNGMLLGVGVEHALTRNWTIKFEYNYLTFGASEMSQIRCVNSVCAINGTSSDSATKQIFKVGANYLINWP